MKITGQDDQSFELWVINYQSSDNTTDEYDSNWLRIGIRLTGFKREWITTDPCMLTWEVKFLADWLQSILAGDTKQRTIEFIEPNLKFELVNTQGDAFRVGIHLNLESKPGWYTEKEIFSFDLLVDRSQLEHSVERLNNELIRFPGRAGVKLI
jgi:hypothetical protein